MTSMFGTEKSAVGKRPARSLQKRLRMLDMLKHLDADSLIELLVTAQGNRSASWCGFAKRQDHAAPVIVSSRDSLPSRSIDAQPR